MKALYLAAAARRRARLIFLAQFTVGANTELTLYSPDIGLSFNLVIQDGTATIQARASDDVAAPVATGFNIGAIYEALVTGGYGVDDYSVEEENIFPETSDDYNWLATRIQDANNCIAVRFVVTTSLMRKQVAGSWSDMGVAGSGVDGGQTAALTCEGTTHKFYIDLEEDFSRTTTDLQTGGNAGLGMGGPDGADGDMAQQEVDNLRVWNTAIYPPPEVVFCDNFSGFLELSNGSHSPLIGDNWTKSFDNSATVSASDGSTSAGGPLNAGVVYTANPVGGYSQYNYRVRYRMVNQSLGDDYAYSAARWQDDDNCYAIETVSGVNASALFSVVAGVWTQIGSSFTVVSDDIVELIVNGSTISAEVNFIEVASGTDTNHTDGPGGYGVGEWQHEGSDPGTQSAGSFRIIYI